MRRCRRSRSFAGSPSRIVSTRFSRRRRAQRVKRRTGFSFSPQSSSGPEGVPGGFPGTEGARLVSLGAVYGVDIKRGKAAVIDIGGGSVEITLGGERPQHARSFKIGVTPLPERFVKSDPLAEREERKLVRHITSEIGEYAKQIAEAGYDRVIGTSG